uniref:Uncharacterized protein n=1 Tax=Gossypium raimondii TaxID=29730 RepID=A0A0D2PPC8_GOSRA|nr:hypothetical protein B456_001G098500 [Gossypium raimondii]
MNSDHLILLHFLRAITLCYKIRKKEGFHYQYFHCLVFLKIFLFLSTLLQPVAFTIITLMGFLLNSETAYLLSEAFSQAFNATSNVLRKFNDSDMHLLKLWIINSEKFYWFRVSPFFIVCFIPTF